MTSKLANALFANAKPSRAAIDAASEIAGLAGGGFVGGITVRSIATTLDLMSRQWGGLWVGGTATLDSHSVSFAPNRMNAIIHENGEALTLRVPLEAITRAEHVGGFISGIIEIETLGALFKIRCFGAKAFAEEIKAALPG